jgi:hypothetical protein
MAAAGSQQRSLLMCLATLKGTASYIKGMASLSHEDQAMSAARPILIVEDDDALRTVLADQVSASGVFRSFEAATLADASCHLAAPEARFDKILLDITLSDGDGRGF